MIKMIAAEFKLKVEMKQIGIRQEAAKMGGIGSCGRELCCSTWLTDFKSVNTTAARYQNLSINQTKLSGQCGRLKCCLNFELDTYLDALQQFPENADTLETAKGNAFLIKKDIFKNLMWYMLQGGSKHYPLSIQRAKEIKRLNMQGVRPEDLEPLDLTANGKQKEVEPEYADLVGQITLKPLERERRRDDRNRNRDNRQGGGRPDNRNENRGERSGPPQQQRGNNQGGQPQRPPQNNPQQQPRRDNNQPQRPPQNQNNNRDRQQPRGNNGNNNGGNNNGGQPRNRPPQNNQPQQPRRDNENPKPPEA